MKNNIILTRMLLRNWTSVDEIIDFSETTTLFHGANGSGKSTLLSLLAGLESPTAGEIEILGQHLEQLNEKERSRFRRAHIGFVFQSYNLLPQFSAWENVAMPLQIRGIPLKERKERAMEILDLVGLRDHALHKPTELSGGQQQRIGIARAIALQPDLIVCDEPVSALDVSVQSQVLNLLKDLQKQYGLTYLFIGHDLSVINFIADRVCVMFLGHVCEVATKEELYSRPMHPYTAFLMDAIPQTDPHRRNQHRRVLMGEVPSPVNLPSGCCFHTRCPYATERCRTEVPELRECDGRMVACHRAGENWD